MKRAEKTKVSCSRRPLRGRRSTSYVMKRAGAWKTFGGFSARNHCFGDPLLDYYQTKKMLDMTGTHPQKSRSVNASNIEPDAGRHSPTDLRLKKTADHQDPISRDFVNSEYEVRIQRLKQIPCQKPASYLLHGC